MPVKDEFIAVLERIHRNTGVSYASIIHDALKLNDEMHGEWMIIALKDFEKMIDAYQIRNPRYRQEIAERHKGIVDTIRKLHGKSGWAPLISVLDQSHGDWSDRSEQLREMLLLDRNGIIEMRNGRVRINTAHIEKKR